MRALVDSVEPLRHWRLHFVGALVFGVLLVGACDPCAGIAGCSSTPHLDVAGQIIDRASGRGAAGVQVSVALAGSPDALGSAVTDDSGNWRVESSQPAGDSVRIDVAVSAPGTRGYVVRSLALRSSTQRGDAVSVGQWTRTPTAKRLFIITSGGAPLAAATVTFSRTAGAAATPEVSSGFTSGSGVYTLELDGDTIGTTIGTLEVSHPSLPTPSRRANFPVMLGYIYEIPHVEGIIGVEGAVGYPGSVTAGGTAADRVAAARVNFNRTGRIARSSPPRP